MVLLYCFMVFQNFGIHGPARSPTWPLLLDMTGAAAGWYPSLFKPERLKGLLAFVLFSFKEINIQDFVNPIQNYLEMDSASVNSR